MGWAIRRPDGTYRAWNAFTQDDVLQPGEVWEQRTTPPPVTTPPSPPSDLAMALDAALASSAPTSAQIKAVFQAWRLRVT